MKFFQKTLIVLFFLFLALYFYKLGSTGLIDVDEPRYPEVAREILESGNWIVPHFNYEVRFDKPILFYWIEAVSMKLFGVNEFACRLPSVLSALLCLSVVFCLLMTFYNVSISLLGVLILMSSFEFTALSRFSITDMTLASFTSSSVISFFLGYHGLVASHRFFELQISRFSLLYILSFIFLALGFLTKGPVVLVLVGLILIPFFWWIGKLDYFFGNYSFWIGFLIFLCLVLPWYIAVHFATSGEFTKAFFGFHNLSRFTSVVSGHKGSLFYFIPVVLIGFLPWSILLIQSILSIVKKGLKNLLKSTKDQLPWFCLWWFIAVFLFFSFSKTKLLTYILPLFPALSLMVTFYVEELISKHASNRGAVIGLGIFFLICLILCGIFLSNFSIILPRELKSLKITCEIIFLAFVLLAGVAMTWASSTKDVTTTVLILTCTFLLLYFSLISFLLPKIDIHSQKLLRTFAKQIPKDVQISTYQIVKPSLVFYGKRKIIKINSLTELQNRLNQPEKFAFVTKKSLLKDAALENTFLWSEDDRYVFYTNFLLSP